MKAKIEISTIVEHPDQHRLDNVRTNENQRNSDFGGVITDNEMESNDSTRRSGPEITSFAMAMHGATQAFVIFLIIFVAYYSFGNGVSLFSWHPPFMILGFLLLMSNAILAYSNNYFLTYRLGFNSRVTWHWVLQTVGGVCSLIGFLCIYFTKARNNAEHFATWHGYLGLITVILSAGAASGGILAKYSFQIRKVLKPLYIKVIHGFFGAVAYSLAITTICFGLYSAWFHSNVNNLVIILLIILTICTGVVVVSRPIITVWSRVTGSRSN